MTAVRVGNAKELESGRMRGVKANDREILLVNPEGTFSAIGNVCTHRGCRLSGGKREAGNVQCPCHGSIFDVKTGNVVSGPAKTAEPSYPVKVENDGIWVEV